MDVMWVPFPEGSDWAISQWCYSFSCYELPWLLRAIPTSLLVVPQLLVSDIVPPIGSFALIIRLFGGVLWWTGSAGSPIA